MTHLDCRICERRVELSPDGYCARCLDKPLLISAFREGCERRAGWEPLRALEDLGSVPGC